MKDLHLHLSGSTNPVLLWELMRENGFRLKSKDFFDFESTMMMDRSEVSSLDSYLEILHRIDEAQSFPRAIELCVYDAYKASYLHGATELQLRWNPVKRSQNQKIDLDTLIVAARAGAERAKNSFGITGSMILCMGRDLDPAANAAIFHKAIQYFEKGVVGLDIAGPEKTPLSKEFEHYYATARTMGMISTVHVGEILHDGVEEELAFVLEKLKPRRIGHGIQIHRFPKLLKIASKLEVEFEICITSNLTTRAVEKLEDFKPIFKAFEDHHIKWSINTDATYPLKTNIRRENELFQSLKG
jgi:adenosine deaminase